MNLLILGITIFFGIHLVPIFPLKNILINRLGENKYKGLFSLIALIGILIIIYGFSSADYYPIWDPLPYSKGLALTLMPNFYDANFYSLTCWRKYTNKH